MGGVDQRLGRLVLDGELKDELAGMLPFAPIASLLIELDARTGFLDCFTHAGGKKLATSPSSSATSSRC